jgi:hypothetical protein
MFIIRVLVVASLFVFSSYAWSVDKPNVKGGFLAFNVYPYLSDVPNDSTFDLSMGASLPNRISYFGFINLLNQRDSAELADTNSFYMEQNLRWQIAEASSFDTTLQYVSKTGDDNDKLRLGVRWRLHDSALLHDAFAAIHVKWSVNLHVLQADHDPKQSWQIEHAFFMSFPYISDRIYLSGFIDHNMNETVAALVPENPVVAEAQLGYRLVDNLYLVGEYRLNEYRRSDINNVAVGLEYKMKW